MYTECQNTVTVTWHVGKLFIMIRSNNIFQPLVECCEVLCHWSIFHNNKERSLFSRVTNYLELRSISDSLDAQHLSLLFVARVHQESFYQNGRYQYRQSRISSREKALLLQQLKSLLISHILTHFSSGDSQVSEEGSGVPAEVSPGSRWRNIHRVCISQAWQVNIRYTSITISWYFPWTDIIPISDISFLKVMQNANYFWSQNQNCKQQN